MTRKRTQLLFSRPHEADPEPITEADPEFIKEPTSARSNCSSSSRAVTARDPPTDAADTVGGVVIPKLDVDRAAAVIQARQRGAMSRQQTRLLYTRDHEAAKEAELQSDRGRAASESVLGPLVVLGSPRMDPQNLLRPVSARLDSEPASQLSPQPTEAASEMELDIAAAAAASEMAEEDAARATADAAEQEADAAEQETAWEAQKAEAQAQAAALVAQIEAEEQAAAEAAAAAAAAAAPSAEEIAAEIAAAEAAKTAEATAAAERAAERAANEKAARALARQRTRDLEKSPERSFKKRQQLAALKAKLSWQRAKLYVVGDSVEPTATSEPPKPLVRLSKLLSNLLRHHAVRVGVQMEKDGWVTIKAALEYLNHGPGVADDGRWESLQGPVGERLKYTEDHLKELVNTGEVRRFELSYTTPIPRIRAYEGHTITTIPSLTKPGVRLVVDEPDDGYTTLAAVEYALHGTYLEVLEGESGILKRGLSTMGRNVVHFGKGIRGEANIVSGMRADCTAYVWVNVHRAIRAGLEFFELGNGTIVCPGDKDGRIPPAFIETVLQLRGDLGAPSVRKVAYVRLIARLYVGSSLIICKVLEKEPSGALSLLVDSADADGTANEPTVLRLSAAPAIMHEAARLTEVTSLLGADTVRAVRGPLYVAFNGAEREAPPAISAGEGSFSKLVVATPTAAPAAPIAGDADFGGMVLEMTGACWVTPDFYGKLGKVELLTTLRGLLLQDLSGQSRSESSFVSCSPVTVLNELWGHGGPLSGLALKTARRAEHVATASEGMLSTTLAQLLESLCIAFMLVLLLL
jgi:2'-phosphotransferase